jgi:diaminopimelate epimerase
MQATGNDFIIINVIENDINYSYKLFSKFLCNRHYSIGGDGLILLERSECADYKMRIINQDGSEAEMCGNGIRCLGKYIYEKGLIDSDEISIETKVGIKNLKLKIEGNKVSEITVDMGEYEVEFEKIPVFYQGIDYGKVVIEGLDIYPISMGNPHAVCFVNELEKIEIEKYGKLIENYKYFPNKTNVEFVKVINDERIKIRVWERGVGETNSCGTGACAAAVISNLKKSTNNGLIVEIKGGELKVNINKNVELIGGAEIVFEGKIEL